MAMSRKSARRSSRNTPRCGAGARGARQGTAEALQWRPAREVERARVVVHCADSETNAALRIRYFSRRRSPDRRYDQDAWPGSSPTMPAHRGVAPATAAARPGRCPCCADDEADWRRRAATPSPALHRRGLLRIYAAHLEATPQIERNLAAWKASSSSR